MVQASEINNRKTLKAWLDARPEDTRQRDAVVIAHRAAMRVLPDYFGAVENKWYASLNITPLNFLFRSLARSVVSGPQASAVKSRLTDWLMDVTFSDDPPQKSTELPPPQTSRKATRASYDAVRVACAAPSHVADVAVEAVEAATNSYSDWQPLRDDAVLLEAGNTPNTSPL